MFGISVLAIISVAAVIYYVQGPPYSIFHQDFDDFLQRIASGVLFSCLLCALPLIFLFAYSVQSTATKIIAESGAFKDAVSVSVKRGFVIEVDTNVPGPDSKTLAIERKIYDYEIVDGRLELALRKDRTVRVLVIGPKKKTERKGG